jgi:hypothetical protein
VTSVRSITRHHAASSPRYLRAVASSWDARIALRAATVALLTLAVAWLVTWATDEGGVPWGERLGRALPLTPVCAAIGTWAGLAPVRARGEAVALAALGRSPARIAAAAVAGGALAAVAAAVAILVARRVDVSGFYPMATHASDWVWQSGGFVDRVRGLRVEADGTLADAAPPQDLAALDAIPPGGRPAAAIATGLSGVALPMLLAHAMIARPAQRTRGKPDRALVRSDAGAAVAAAATCATCLVCFQAAAARHLPAVVAVVPPLALLAFAVWKYRAGKD